MPVYLEYTKVARSLEQVRDEHAAIDTNPALIRRSLERRWDVEDISSIGWKEIEIDKTADARYLDYGRDDTARNTLDKGSRHGFD